MRPVTKHRPAAAELLGLNGPFDGRPEIYMLQGTEQAETSEHRLRVRALGTPPPVVACPRIVRDIAGWIVRPMTSKMLDGQGLVQVGVGVDGLPVLMKPNVVDPLGPSVPLNGAFLTVTAGPLVLGVPFQSWAWMVARSAPPLTAIADRTGMLLDEVVGYGVAVPGSRRRARPSRVGRLDRPLVELMHSRRMSHTGPVALPDSRSRTCCSLAADRYRMTFARANAEENPT